MSVNSVQFTVAAHIMAVLGFYHGEEISSATLAESVYADPSFVRKSLSNSRKLDFDMSESDFLTYSKTSIPRPWSA
jgi:hypothetical protein